MCGICGIYEYGKAEPAVTTGVVAAMRDRMIHRGPDDSGVYVTPDRRVGLGHRRLSIVDLSAAGRNPMSNEDGRIWITFNGEIYNHLQLRPDLISGGHQYRSETDTETILHLYEEKGLDFVQHLDGFFAIGLWDEAKGRLILVRDRVGIKPLYYAIAQGRLIFASEIKAILAHPSVSRDVDETALYHYLSFLTTPAPLTMFAGIRKLAPGSMLVCSANGGITIDQYWDALPKSEPYQLTEEETAEEVYRLLSESVRKRLMSDVPFGLFLSGGVDSTATAALMSELVGGPIRTFTVGFRDNPEYNELEEARLVARHYQTDHHEVTINQQDLLDSLPAIVFHQDEPIADPVCVPLYFLSKLAQSTGTKVLQVGEGADELFCGYRDYAAYLDLYQHLWRHVARLPAPVRMAMSAVGISVLKAGGWRFLPKGRKMAPDILRRLAAGEELFWSGAFVFDELSKSRILSPAAKARLGGSGQPLSSYSVVQADLQRLLRSKPDADQLQKMIYQELKLRLPELLLMRVDKITMAASIEARVPFLDYKLVEFAMNIPSRMKYKNGETKHILKRALRGRIPEHVINRPKKGFGAPINEWMFDRLGGFLEDSLFNSSLRKREFFDYDYVRLLLDRQSQGRVNNSFFLWCLLNLTMWYDHWIEGGNSSTDSSGGHLPTSIRAEEVELPASV
ncbi:MAG TPA: asparagine synthase (glutamine-hydrolyzing) [Blastocatellia bacterium]|nr:asparagine synthase (glutamine-hydrolyzing) [Blastocatellia bacterium]